VSEQVHGPGWWQASDGKWYPPPGDREPRAVVTEPTNGRPQGEQLKGRELAGFIRVTGFVILVVAAVAIFFGMKPSSSDAAVRSALSDASVNEATAESAPQQQVVNGWAAKDLLAIIGRKEPDERPAALLVVLVAAVAWGFVAPASVVRAPAGGSGIDMLASRNLTRPTRGRLKGQLVAASDRLAPGEVVLDLAESRHEGTYGLLVVTTERVSFLPDQGDAIDVPYLNGDATAEVLVTDEGHIHLVVSAGGAPVSFKVGDRHRADRLAGVVRGESGGL
jgi:hypothetical protein